MRIHELSHRIEPPSSQNVGRHVGTNPLEMQFYENMWVDRYQLDEEARISLHKSSKIIKQPFVKNS